MSSTEKEITRIRDMTIFKPKSPPKNLIHLAVNKLIDVDATLPVLMELKWLYPQTNIMLIFYNDNQLNVIKKNYNIWEAIQRMDARIYVIRSKNAFITLLRLILFLPRVLFKYNIVMKSGDTLPNHRITMKVLKIFSKTLEVKTYLVSQTSQGYRNNYAELELQQLSKNGISIEKRFFGGYYDYFLSILSAEQFKNFFDAEAPQHKIVKIGYPRKLPQWQKFVNEAVKRNQNINGDRYFLYILSTLSRTKLFYEEPHLIELLEESLRILKKYNNKIKTVFRPHFITDLGRLEALLEEVGYTNYVIDQGHPMVLSSNAKFVFGNRFSMTMYDAYYLGKLVVEYCQYDPELLIRWKKQSYGGSCCDFFINRDKKQLDEILSKLIGGSIEVERDAKFIKENFTNTPQEFFDLWEKLLANTEKYP